MRSPNKLLLAYDGSECGDQALDDLSRAGLPRTIEAEVVSVAEVWMPYPLDTEQPPSGEVTPTTITRLRARALREAKEAQQLASAGVAKLQKAFPDWKVAARTYCDAPAWGILQAAERFDPDLIVLGSHGRSALGRLFIGSVSQKVLTEARCSVRIGRERTTAAGAPVRVLLGVDGTPDSNEAVEAVAMREWPSGSSVTVIAADGFPDSSISVEMTYDAQWLEESVASETAILHKVVAQAVERLHAAGLDAAGEVRHGTPSSILLDAAQEWGADSIVLGARGHRFMQRFLLGSVSNAVATRAECSVEIIRQH